MTINTKIANLAVNAGYEIDNKSLDDLRKEYAIRSLSSSYCDQFDAMLGEAIGMIRMTKQQLEAFVAQ